MFQLKSFFTGRISRLFLFALIVFVVIPMEVQAQRINEPFDGKRGVTLAPIAGLVYSHSGLALGVRLGIPIIHNGFIPTLNNSVSINFGVDTYFTPVHNDLLFALSFPITLHWEFYFNSRWSAFGELGANIYLDAAFLKGGQFLFAPDRWLFFAFGGKMHFSDNFGLVLRVGYPYVSFGVVFTF